MAGPLDGTELGDLLADLTNGTNIHHGIHLIAAGIRAIAEDRSLDRPAIQLLNAQLCGSPDGWDVIGAIGHLGEDLNSDARPAVRSLPDDRRKEAAHQGWLTRHHLTDPELRESAALANTALDTREEVHAVTDAERKELSKKVAETNRRSENRPR